jgi:hypothetical protein
LVIFDVVLNFRGATRVIAVILLFHLLCDVEIQGDLDNLFANVSLVLLFTLFY